MKRKLVYIGFAFAHHKGTHAGYHQVKNYIQYDIEIDCQKYFDYSQIPNCDLTFIAKIKRKILRRLFGVNAIPWFIFRIIWLGLRNKNLVFHYIYGENVFFPWIRVLMRKGNKIVCTFHQPFEFFAKEEKYKNKVLSSDYIILVSETEINKFETITGKKNVTYIPHGISSDFYHIDNKVSKENILLTVGNWLRDFKFADCVYRELLKLDKDLTIHIVSNPSNKELITPDPRICFFSGITDEELRMEYLKCRILFLPLTRYTANNSLLESGATGCNILIASDYPDNSYIPENFLTMVPMSLSSAASAIQTINNRDFNYGLSDYIISNYGWSNVAKQIRYILLK